MAKENQAVGDCWCATSRSQVPQPVYKARMAWKEPVQLPSFSVSVVCLYPPALAKMDTEGKDWREAGLSPAAGTVPLTLAVLGASQGS